ncbi:MAG: anaerobic carbon-monoxide dehydrogenase catalytic subunit [Nanoarchaeota archaeon]|nr:anaerobic carbon-monoxide dehydrogenase catalytic subunit [Nanoarchaeota archaeon]
MNSWVDPKIVSKARRDKAKLVFDRFEEQQPQCVFGLGDVCCKNCFQGPCRIIPGKQEEGVCGANADLIVTRNLLRHVAAGTACHTDHAKEVLLALLKISEGKTKSYPIKDKEKLFFVARKLGLKTFGKSVKQVAKSVVLEALEEFRRQEGLLKQREGLTLNWFKVRANKERMKAWSKLDILPVNADAEISHALHQTTMGNDADPVNVLLSVLKLGLVDGFAGMSLATDVQDIIFGTPYLTKSTANLGVLKKDWVNIIVHGHLPLLSEKVLEWSRKMGLHAKKVGAKGINVVGMCCTGNELLMRQGVPMAGHVMQQEMALVTGAVDATVVDLQCIYPSLQDIASCYNTRLITTIDFVKIPGALHLPFEVENADRSAKKIIKEAVKAFQKRKGKNVLIPEKVSELYGGFSVEAIKTLLSKLDKKNPFKPLINEMKSGNVLGIVAVVGCRNAKLRGQAFQEELTRILIKNNVLVVGTGCWAHAAAQADLMNPRAVKLAGDGLKHFLEKVGEANGLEALPPAWHMGSCVDCSRIGALFTQLSEASNTSLPDLPIACSAPEYMAEKSLAIGVYFLDLGVTTHVNPALSIKGSKIATRVLTKDLEKLVGSRVIFGSTPETAAKKIIGVLKSKRNL